jgi:hypothetical protein
MPKSDHTKEKTAPEWIEEIKAGIEWRERTSGHDDSHWKRYSQYYSADWESIGNYTNGYVPANRVFAYVRASVPNTYYRNPKVMITGSVPDFGLTLENVDNKLLGRKHMNLKKHLKRSLLDAQIAGVFILKFGFNSRFEVAEADDTPPKRRIEYSRGTKKGMPWVGRVLPINFVFPHGLIDAEDAQWCAEYVVRPYKDVMLEKNYKNKEKIKGVFTRDIEDIRTVIKRLIASIGSSPRGKELRKLGLVGLWHLWDRRTGKLYIIDSDSEVLLYDEKKAILDWGLPFIFSALNENTSSVWGVSDVKIMEPDVLDLNDMKTEFRKVRRTNIYKFLVRNGTFKTQEECDRFFDANDIRSAFMVNGKPGDMVQEINSNIPPHLYLQNKVAEDELRTNVRFSRNRGGEFASGRRTATEAQNVDEANSVTDSERRDIIADSVGNLLDGVNHIIFSLWSAEDVKMFLGLDQPIPFWPSSPDDEKLAGLSLEVNGEDTAPPNTLLAQATAQRFYEITRNDPTFNPYVAAVEVALAHNKHPSDVIDPLLGTLVQLMSDPEVGQQIKQQVAVLIQQVFKAQAGGQQNA